MSPTANKKNLQEPGGQATILISKEALPDGWINDSILDANYLFCKFEQKTGANNKEFMDSELDKLANHK